jgi:hypothetical protein
MCVPGVSSRVKTEGVSEVEAEMDKAFSPIAEAQPEDDRNASVTSDDGATFALPEPEKQREPRKRH